MFQSPVHAVLVPNQVSVLVIGAALNLNLWPLPGHTNVKWVLQYFLPIMFGPLSFLCLRALSKPWLNHFFDSSFPTLSVPESPSPFYRPTVSTVPISVTTDLLPVSVASPCQTIILEVTVPYRYVPKCPVPFHVPLWDSHPAPVH